MIFYRLDENGKRIYTLSEENTYPAAPAKYSVQDEYSQDRIKMKTRYKIFPFDD
ncbi:hypothetical protein NUSPORA_02124 [Nucleospora cyclopteri]